MDNNKPRLQILLENFAAYQEHWPELHADVETVAVYLRAIAGKWEGIVEPQDLLDLIIHKIREVEYDPSYEILFLECEGQC